MPPKRAAAAAAGALSTTALPLINVRATKRVRGTSAAAPPARSPSPPLPFAPPPPPPPLCPRSVLVALSHLRAADPRLGPLIDAHGQRCAERLGGGSPAVAAAAAAAAAPDAPPPPPTPCFPRLVQTILAQQLSWKAASTIHRRLLTEAGVMAPQQDGTTTAAHYEAAALRLTPGHVLALPEARVRSAGVSGAKAAALRDLAQRFSDGRLSDEILRRASAAAPAGLHAALLAHKQQLADGRRAPCPAAEAAAALLAVRGIGPWSLDMASMFILQAPDVLPAGDLGVRKGLAKLRGGGGGGGQKANKGGAGAASALPDAAAAERLTAPWRPYRSVGSWLMWRLAEEGS